MVAAPISAYAFVMVTQHAACWPAATTSSSGSSVKHFSMRNGQRGLNSHPGGGAMRSGGSPSMDRRRSCFFSSTRGSERSSDHVYGCWGASKICSAGPSSTISPAYITTTRLQRPAITPRLCVIRMIDVPIS